MSNSLKFSLISIIILTTLTSAFVDWHWGGIAVAGFFLIYISKGMRNRQE